MKRSKKIALIVLMAGIILFAASMCILKWDFNALGLSRYETTVYDIPEAFDSVAVLTETSDIRFILSEDGKCRIECLEPEHMQHTVYIQEKTLVIQLADNRNWYDHFGQFSFESPAITVYLPEPVYTTLYVDSKTSDIDIPESISFQNVTVTGITGSLQCLSAVPDTLRVNLTTGNITLRNVTSRIMQLSVTTGNIILDQCDAEEIRISTTTGNVKGTLLTDKVFTTETKTGSINIPETESGGICDITTVTGDIHMEISE